MERPNGREICKNDEHRSAPLISADWGSYIEYIRLNTRHYRAVQKFLKITPLGMGVWECVGVGERTPMLPHSAPFRQSILGRGGRIPLKKFLTHR